MQDPGRYPDRRQHMADGDVRVGGIDPKGQAVIDSLQPHQSVGVIHPLWMLRTLDNINKHRLLHVVYSVVGHLGHKRYSNIDYTDMKVEWTNEPVTTDTSVAEQALSGQVQQRDLAGSPQLYARSKGLCSQGR